MQTRTDFQSTTAVPDTVWDGFVATELDGNFLQTAAWGRAKSEWGWQPRRVAVRRDGVLVAGAQVLFRRLPLGRSIAYMPRGPVAPADDPALLAALFGEAHRLCRSEGALLLTVEPNWPCPTSGGAALQALGFRPAPKEVQPSATILLDLRPSEEEILGQMHQKWRYNIRLAARKEVTVRTGGLPDFGTFQALTQATGERDAFATRPQGYYEAVFRAFGERARLFVAEWQGRALAAIFVAKVGRTATYLYGASGNEERNRMPNHLLQWEAMRWARAEGCQQYDFWGIPPEVPDEGEVTAFGTGGLWGVFRFKQGFGGRVVKYPGAYDYVYSRVGYLAYQQYLRRRGGADG